MVIARVRPVHNWRNKTNQNKRYPVHLEIRINGARKYFLIPVPQKVADHEWKGKDDAWVGKSHPFAFEINNKIREKKEVVNGLIRRYYLYTQSLTFPVVFRELKKSANANSFNDFFQDYVNHPSDKIEPDTLKKYRACLQHLNDFNPLVRFYDLTPELIEKFYQYLRAEAKSPRKKQKGLIGSTIDSYFDAFRKIVSLARKDHQISREHEETLFEDLHIEVKKSKRTFLSIEDIRKWKECNFTKEEKHLERDRNVYLLQIYTGYYYKDLINLKKEHLIKDHEYGYIILGERDKNDEQTIIPLFKFPDAEKLVELYTNNNPKDPHFFRRDIFLAEPVYNRHLKEIAGKAGLVEELTKKLSNKVARHTNAQLWIRLGAKRPVVSKMLGHSKEQTTETYFRVNVIEVIEGTSHVDFSKLGI